MRFLKNDIFLIATVILAWYLWGRPEAGVLSFLAFIAAYFAAFRRIYIILTNISETSRKKIHSVTWMGALGLFGIWLWDRWGFPGLGGTFAGISFILIIYFVPQYFARDSKARIQLRVLIAVGAAMAAALIAGFGFYTDLRYEKYASLIRSGDAAVSLAGVHRMLDFAMVHDRYREPAVRMLCDLISERSAQKTGQESCSGQYAVKVAHILGSSGIAASVPFDFSGTDLQNANFQKVDFSGASFLGCNLSGGDFYKADLSGCDFDRAVLNGVDFLGTKVSGSSFYVVTAKKARFSWADFSESDLRFNNFENSSFVGSNLRECIISGRTFNNVILVRAKMQQINAVGAQFNNSDLRYAKLNKANLERARFVNADLKYADLTGAKVKNADFRGADLRHVKGLTDEMLRQIKIDQGTRLDAGRESTVEKNARN